MQSALSFTRIRDLFQQSEFLAKQSVGSRKLCRLCGPTVLTDSQTVWKRFWNRTLRGFKGFIGIIPYWSCCLKCAKRLFIWFARMVYIKDSLLLALVVVRASTWKISHLRLVEKVKEIRIMHLENDFFRRLIQPIKAFIQGVAGVVTSSFPERFMNVASLQALILIYNFLLGWSS